MSDASPVFLMSHTITYEVISAPNGKYIVWKLFFPRVGDTMFTVDKLMDFCVWQELYNVLQQRSSNYDSSSASSLVPQFINKKRLKLLFKQIEMSRDDLRDVLNVDWKLVAAVLRADLVLVNNATDDGNHSVNVPVHVQATGCPGGNSHHKTDERSSTDPSSSENTSSSDFKNRKVQPPLPSSVCSRLPCLTINDICSNSVPSFTETTESVRAEASRPSATSSSHSFIRTVVYPKKHQSPPKSARRGSMLNLTGNIADASNENLVVPQNLHQLGKAMSNSKYLERFGYEGNHGNLLKKYRLFDAVHSPNGEFNWYAAFHSAQIIEMINGREDCRLFFYFSPELLKQCNSFVEVKLGDVKHVLMVFWSHLGGAVPFAFFLLPDTHAALRHVPKVINRWFHHSTTVIGCTTPYNQTLQHSIAEVWPQAKIIGCSAEFKSELKAFASENKMSGADGKSTLLACSLCYLDENNFSAGIKVIKRYTPSEYGTKLVRHLRTRWLGTLKSVNGEDVVHRSLVICRLVGYQIEQDYFHQESSLKLKHIWDFIDFLQRLTSQTVLELRKGRMCSGPSDEIRRERERRYKRASAEFEENVKMMRKVEAVEKFMLDLTEKFYCLSALQYDN
ncbi:uncharacterized protein LOC119069678 isoform X2 [Bradysia coprophila]|uniref:uncharacterized protein LOC119069678 isoform X2 n=1 Tax=Bradysia coprophila TaxID=38358 RepID=UPI00187D86A5|nr:uncharacterized protein LOC119069678 isoform X2 [Bradysia coprophila]